MAVATDYAREGGIRNDFLGEWIWVDNNGRRHRGDDFPAVICDDGCKAWYKHGRLHRLFDQAIVFPTSDWGGWYVNGERYDTEEEFEVARDAYCQKHTILMPGHKTKRATPYM